MASADPKSRASLLYEQRPAFMYGTAWKKDQTKRLVKEALAAGFRTFDTAVQPRHYQEALVGEALREAFAEGIVQRSDMMVSDQESFHVSGLMYIRSKPNSPRSLDRIWAPCPTTP